MRLATPIVKLLRVVATLTLALSGIILLLFLLWLVPNLFDEPLTPVAAALLAPRSDPLPDNENLFVAFAGFSAPSGQSMLKVGEERIKADNRVADQRLTVVSRFSGSITDNLSFKGNMQAWGWATSSVWSTAKSRRAEVSALMAANQELYQRYLALHELSGYFDPAHPGANTPYADVSSSIRELFLADTAVRLQTGTSAQKEAALADLQADIRMWKIVLDGHGRPFSEVIAAVSLHADFLLLGDMVTDPDFDPAPFADRWPTLLTPFELQDWKIGTTYRWQMIDTTPWLKAIARRDRAPDAYPASWWPRLSAQFFKLNATENLQAEQTQRLIALGDGDPGNYLERRDAFRVWQQGRDRAIVGINYYNPLGKMLVSIAPPDEDDYIARVFDVAAFQRLVFLAYQIRVRCIESNEVAAFMRQHPDWATHPIDARPFQWNAASGELSVLPVGKNTRKTRFSLKLPGFSHCPRN